MDVSAHDWEDVLVRSGCAADRAKTLGYALANAVGGAEFRAVGGAVKDDEAGKCYVLMFANRHKSEVAKLGRCPTVAALRRFANSVRDPHLGANVDVTLETVDGTIVWHVVAGDIPASFALACMDKSARVGAVTFQKSGIMNESDVLEAAGEAAQGTHKRQSVGLLDSLRGYPVGESDEFPADWIPARRECIVAWDYRQLVIREDRTLDLKYIHPKHKPHDGFADMDADVSKVKWEFRLHPLAPPSDEFTVFEDGVPVVVDHWTSPVACDKNLHRFAVRGMNIMAIMTTWRPSKEMFGKKPNGSDNDGLPGEKDELFASTMGDGGDIFVDGKCYLRFFEPSGWLAASRKLGYNPTAGAIKAHARDKGVVWSNVGLAARKMSKGRWHIVSGEQDPEAVLDSIPLGEFVGSTQETVELSDRLVAKPTTRVLDRPVAANAVEMDVPVAALLSGKTGDQEFSWTPRSLNSVMKYFESAELLSFHINVTIAGGDNDTTAFVAFDTWSTVPTAIIDWHSAPYAMVLSGNVNGATAGMLSLPTDHLFGKQLKGMSIGTTPPYLHCKLVTKVTTTMYIRGMCRVRLAGKAVVSAVNMFRKPATPGKPKLQREESESEAEDVGRAVRKVAG